MNKSESITKLIADFIKFHSDKDLPLLTKDAINPFYKSKYIALSEYLKMQPILNKHNLTFIQTIKMSENFSPIVVTTLLHTSGEYISSELGITPIKENNPQDIGKSITYARRYALAALLGTPEEDDDGESNRKKLNSRQFRETQSLTNSYQKKMSQYVKELSPLDLTNKIKSLSPTILKELGFGGKSASDAAIKFYLNLKKGAK